MERHHSLARMKTPVWRLVRGVEHSVHGRFSMNLPELRFRLQELG